MYAILNKQSMIQKMNKIELLWSVEALIPTCHAQYATLSKRYSKVPPRIDPHIETLLQGGYHYINIT